MLEAVLGGLLLVLQWPAIGYLGAGLLIGLYLGAVPGLSGLSGMAILLPFTFGMDAMSALAFLLGMYAVTTTSDTISSVLLGVPGTAASQATVLDGYPLARQGQAARAFGAAFTVSAVGGVLGALLLGISIPIIRPLIMTFGVAEFFMLAILGLTMVGALSGRSLLLGMIAAALGLMLSMVGYSPNGAVPRFTLGQLYLLDGLALVPVALGLFAIPEVVELATRSQSISVVPKGHGNNGILVGVRDAFRNWWLVLRSSAIGMYIGMLPGLGGSIADWIAYGHAVQSAKDKSQFGKGDIRGVIAPESANNAVKGADLVPTIAFGIPGSAPMAILLGAFLIHGLEPGPQMLSTKLDITFGLVWTLVIANIVAAILLMALANQLAKLTFVRGHLIVPGVVLFLFMGAWMSTSSMGDWIALLLFGVLGCIMKQLSVPRPPMLLGFILGPIMERSLFLATQYFGPIGWLFRPVSLLVLVLIVITIIAKAVRLLRQSNALPSESDWTQPVETTGGRLLFAIPAFAIFAISTYVALTWSFDARLFPVVIGVIGLLLSFLVVVAGVWRFYFSAPGGVSEFRLQQSDIFAVAAFLAVLALIPLTALIVGQPATFLAFVALYLLFWGSYGWKPILAYTFGAWAVIELIFNRSIGVMWHPSWIDLSARLLS